MHWAGFQKEGINFTVIGAAGSAWQGCTQLSSLGVSFFYQGVAQYVRETFPLMESVVKLVSKFNKC